MKKILLVLNKPNREIPIMESIKQELLKLQADAIVEIREMCSPGFNKFVLTFRPDVILTFPFTCVGFSKIYYIFKVLFKTKIICFRAEGVIGLNSDYDVKWATGFDNYGESLVDYELFWGCNMAKAVGDNLLLQRKISSRERIKFVGYPRLEKYFVDGEQPLLYIPPRIINKIDKYTKQNIILFITGFHLANYTRQDLFNAKDLDAENNINNLLEGVEISKQFRLEWIKNIINTANINQNQLFVVKKHPIERREDYSAFDSISNILYIYEDIEIQHFLPFVGLFLHYGSTALVDSYLSKVPSVYVYSSANKQWYADLGWPSSVKIEIGEIPTVIKKYLSGNVSFAIAAEIKRILKDNFNIEEGRPYKPSQEIATFILASEEAQRIPLSDRYLWRAIATFFIDSGLFAISRTVKWIFRIPTDVPIFQKPKMS